MGFGAYHPYPRRFGGGRPRLKVVHDALNAGRGTAIDASTSTTVAWVENMAFARAIVFDGWGTNERLGNQWDPRRMTDMLERWEKILGIVPDPAADGRTRRTAVRARLQRFITASSIHSRILNILMEQLGDFFGAIEYVSNANATVHVPDATYPWGTVADGYPWMSTVARVHVLLAEPEGATEEDMVAAASKVAPALDGVVPAWVAFDYYRAPSNGPAIAIAGGPSVGGFYLDDDRNLDWSAFDV